MKKAIYTLSIFIVTIATISAFGLDTKIQSLLFDKASNSWPYAHFPLWTFLYNYGNKIAVAIGAISLVVFLLSLFINKIRSAKNKALFLVLVLLVGPSLIVQTLKVTWGRPRPCETINYGGTLEFRTPFEPNFKLAGNTNTGNSFPGGHAAVGFYAIALYFIFRKRWILALTVGYGILMSAARMAQGAHFLSDIVSSFFIVYICIELFGFLIIKKQ
jgi:membrane-associated PAP2 superfamily phosphatase